MAARTQGHKAVCASCTTLSRLLKLNPRREGREGERARSCCPNLDACCTAASGVRSQSATPSVKRPSRPCIDTTDWPGDFPALHIVLQMAPGVGITLNDCAIESLNFRARVTVLVLRIEACEHCHPTSASQGLRPDQTTVTTTVVSSERERHTGPAQPCGATTPHHHHTRPDLRRRRPSTCSSVTSADLDRPQTRLRPRFRPPGSHRDRVPVYRRVPRLYLAPTPRPLLLPPAP